MTPKDLALSAVKILDEKKAMDISAIAIEELTIVADYFVLATATSNTHVRALVDDVEFHLQEQGIEPLRIQGRSTGWTLLDYGSVVVHIFQKENRELYNLERLWADAPVLDLSDILTD